MFNLKYVSGAVPGKPVKRQITSNNHEAKIRHKDYEETKCFKCIKYTGLSVENG